MPRVLVAYASGTGCDSACAIDIAKEIADVPDLEVDARPMSRVASIEAYSAVYIGWVHPADAGRRELERFLSNNAMLLVGRAVWIVHRHPRCAHNADARPTKMTRLLVTPPAPGSKRPTFEVPSARKPEGLTRPAARHGKAPAETVGV